MGEIATRGMIRAKVSGFSSGNDNECLTKAEILATGGARVTGSYGDNECPVIDDVLPNVITWNYYFSVSPTSLTFVSTGESKPVSITSYRRKVVNGIETGEQETVYWSHATEGSGYTTNGGGDMITFSNNTTTSIRTGRITYTQQLSGITAVLEVNQQGGIMSKRYYISITPGSHKYPMRSTIAFNFIVKCSVDTLINGYLISSAPSEWEVAGLGGHDSDHFTYYITNGVLAVKPVRPNTVSYKEAIITVKSVGDSSVRASADLEHSI